jgi:hypothetical protein
MGFVCVKYLGINIPSDDVAYIDYLRFWMNVLVHPGKATKRTLGMKAALKLYYSLSIIPIVLGLMVVYAVGGFNPFSTSSPGMFGLYPSLLGAPATYRLEVGMGYMLLFFLVLMPLDILINSGVYHLLMGKLFKFYKKEYAAVFTAALYGALPVLLAYWLYPAGFLGLAIIGIFALWGLIVEIIAFSNQLGMSRFKAFCTFLLYAVIVVVVASVAGALFSFAAL